MCMPINTFHFRVPVYIRHYLCHTPILVYADSVILQSWLFTSMFYSQFAVYSSVNVSYFLSWSLQGCRAGETMGGCRFCAKTTCPSDRCAYARDKGEGNRSRYWLMRRVCIQILLAIFSYLHCGVTAVIFQSNSGYMFFCYRTSFETPPK